MCSALNESEVQGDEDETKTAKTAAHDILPNARPYCVIKGKSLGRVHRFPEG